MSGRIGKEGISNIGLAMKSVSDAVLYWICVSELYIYIYIYVYIVNLVSK